MNPEIENKLSTKIVLLTGAGKGIGLEAAKYLQRWAQKLLWPRLTGRKGWM